MEGGADVAETTYTPFDSQPDAAPVRLIVRRVKPTPGSQLALLRQLQLSRVHPSPTGTGDTLDLEADHRRHAEIENAIRDLKYGVGLNHLPSGRFPANAAWLAVQSLPRTRYGVMAHNLARWTARIGLGKRTGGHHQDPAAAVLLPGRTPHPLGPPPDPASSPGLALGKPVRQSPSETARPATPCLTAATAPDPSARLPNRLAASR